MGKNFTIWAVKAVLFGAVLLLAFGQTALAAGQTQFSGNWSGYMSTMGKFTSVSASWVVPNVIPAQNFSGDMTWVGIGGFSSPDLIQAGTLALVSNGIVTYQAWYETLPLPVQMAGLNVNAGDSVSIKISLQSNDLWQIELSNNTMGQTFRTTVFYNSSFSSAEWIEEMPTQSLNTYVPLDNFGSVNFTSVSAEINGSPLNFSQLIPTAINMIGPKADTLAVASEINGDGSGFSVSRTAPLSSTASAAVNTVLKTLQAGLKAQKSFDARAVSEPKFKVPLMPRGPMPETLFLK